MSLVKKHKVEFNPSDEGVLVGGRYLLYPGLRSLHGIDLETGQENTYHTRAGCDLTNTRFAYDQVNQTATAITYDSWCNQT